VIRSQPGSGRFCQPTNNRAGHMPGSREAKNVRESRGRGWRAYNNILLLSARHAFIPRFITRCRQIRIGGGLGDVETPKKAPEGKKTGRKLISTKIKGGDRDLKRPNSWGQGPPHRSRPQEGGTSGRKVTGGRRKLTRWEEKSGRCSICENFGKVTMTKNHN